MTLESLDAAALPVLAWVGTYLLHSTLLIGLVWVITRFGSRIEPTTRDSMWKAALVGGVLTASLQTAAGLQPSWGATLADEVGPPAREIAAPMRTPSATGYVFMSAGSDAFELRTYASGDAPVLTAPTPVAMPEEPAGATATVEPRAATILLGLLGLGALFALFRLGVTIRHLGTQLRPRRDVIEDPLLETFLALCQRAGVKRRVRLTAAEGLGSPVALWRREICVPERAVEGLATRQQESMLAHELAHVLRRDPWWLAGAAVLESIFFFQPLNRVARRNMQDTAELICDDFAVRMTGSGVHLAKCLAEVATWIDEGGVPLASPMATADASSLVRRIKRLLGDRKLGRESGPRRVGVVVALFSAMVLAAPAVSVASPVRERSVESEAVALREASFAEVPAFAFDFEGVEVDVDPGVVVVPPDVSWMMAFEELDAGEDESRRRAKRKLKRKLRKHKRKARKWETQEPVIIHVPRGLDEARVRELERRAEEIERELEARAHELERRAREIEARGNHANEMRIRIGEREVAELVERAMQQQAEALRRAEEAYGRALEAEGLDAATREKVERAVRRAMEEQRRAMDELRRERDVREAPRAPAPPARPRKPGRRRAAPPAPPRRPAEPSSAPVAPADPSPVLIPL